MGKVAVVGHVEFVHFFEVERVPLQGEIAHARSNFLVPGGGGSVAARQMLLLEGEAHFFTAVGDDERGALAVRELSALGITVHAAVRPVPQRVGMCFVDDEGERTITVSGERLGASGEDDLPWDLLAECDSVYITAGDQGAWKHARRARRLVATSRVLADFQRSGLVLDALVGSRHDRNESFEVEAVSPRPRLMVQTAGGEGGVYWTESESGAYPPVPLPGPVKDAYGCGDSFAAGLTWALGRELPLPEAFEVAARCGATCLTGRGPYERQYAP